MELKDKFKNPPNEYRMMPFWFWNHEMVEKEVERQIRDHQEHGIGGEFIHPRHGRLTPYMGKRWMENVEHAADIGKELGMPIYLYDEDNWPSGPVGGLITGPDHPENRGKYIMVFDEMDFDSGNHVKYELDYHLISPESEFFAALAVPSPKIFADYSTVIDRQIDITKQVDTDKHMLIWDVPDVEEESWTVVFFHMGVVPPDGNMNGYIDILSKETCQQFIDETHEKYAQWFIDQGKDDYLGTVVPGIFTDEPSMAHAQRGGGFGDAIVFTPTMPQVFKEVCGYDFNETLISLVHNTGPISAKHRCDHWKVKVKMYVEAFYKQIYECCEKYNWVSTGHINGEGVFPNHISQHGDYFKVFEYMHYGGIDQLTEECRPERIENLWNMTKNPYVRMGRDHILTCKLGSSAAHLLGKPRMLVESFGTSAWVITLAGAKKVNDFLIATGSDLFVPHDFAYSEDGYRKMDHPASFNYQPYYAHWKKLADHNGRLCATLNASTGVLKADVLLFYAANTFYAEMAHQTSTLAELIGITFTHNGDCLYRQQIDYELANEDMVLGESRLGNIKDTEKGTIFQIRDESFKTMLLGPITCISMDFAIFLLKFYNEGGKILASHVVAFKDPEVGESDEIAAIMEKIFGFNPKDHYLGFDSGKPEYSEFKLIENSNDKGGKAIFIQCDKKEPYKSNYYPLMVQAMEKLIKIEDRDIYIRKNAAVLGNSDTCVSPAYIMAKHKKTDGEDFYFLTNTSVEFEYFSTQVELNIIPEENGMELWDSETGEIIPFNDWGISNGKMVMKLDFPLFSSYFFKVKGKSGNTSDIADKPIPSTRDTFHPKKELEFKTQSIPLNDSWKCDMNDPNVAMLYKKWESSYDINVGKAWGYTNIRTFKHKFNVENKDEIGPLKLVIEGLVGDYAWCWSTTDILVGGDSAHFKMPTSLALKINGKSAAMHFDFTPEYVDPCWVVVNITNMVENGENEVEFVCTSRNHSAFHVVNDPWRLIGKFEMEEIEGIPYLKNPREQVKLGDLCEQGFARYHGGFVYSQDVTIPSDFDAENHRLIFNISDTTDCIEVHVNGEIHEVLWHNWFTDIGSKVKPGSQNTIKLVYYGIAQNMMATNVFPTGLTGKVELDIYSRK